MAPHLIRRNVALYYAFVFMAQFLLWGGVWIKYLIDERGLELKWILFMDLPFWLLVATLQAPTGALADHLGRKKMLALSGALYAITILGFGFTTNYWMLFADYVIWAFAITAQTGADQALLYDSLKLAGQENRFQKIVSRGSALSLSAAFAGVVLGAILATRTSLAFVVQISAIFPLISMTIALCMHEPPIERHAERHYWADLRSGLHFAWAMPRVRYTLLVGGVLMTGTFGPVVLIQPFLIDHDVSTALFGWLQAPLRLVSVAGSLLAFWVVSRMGLPRLLVMSCGVVFASYAGLALADASVAFAFFAMPAAMSGLAMPVISAHLNDEIPSERRATILSILQLVFALQVAFFEPALGFFADGLSLRAAFIFCVVYFALIMPPLLYLWRRAHGSGPIVVARGRAESVAAGGG